MKLKECLYFYEIEQISRAAAIRMYLAGLLIKGVQRLVTRDRYDEANPIAHLICEVLQTYDAQAVVELDNWEYYFSKNVEKPNVEFPTEPWL